MRRKLGAVALLGGDATPSNTTLSQFTFTSVPNGILNPSSHLATIDMGQKFGEGAGCALFSGGGEELGLR